VYNRARHTATELAMLQPQMDTSNAIDAPLHRSVVYGPSDERTQTTDRTSARPGTKPFDSTKDPTPYAV